MWQESEHCDLHLILLQVEREGEDDPFSIHYWQQTIMEQTRMIVPLVGNGLYLDDTFLLLGALRGLHTTHHTHTATHSPPSKLTHQGGNIHLTFPFIQSPMSSSGSSLLTAIRGRNRTVRLPPAGPAGPPAPPLSNSCSLKCSMLHCACVAPFLVP